MFQGLTLSERSDWRVKVAIVERSMIVIVLHLIYHYHSSWSQFTANSGLPYFPLRQHTVLCTNACDVNRYVHNTYVNCRWRLLEMLICSWITWNSWIMVCSTKVLCLHKNLFLRKSQRYKGRMSIMWTYDICTNTKYLRSDRDKTLHKLCRVLSLSDRRYSLNPLSQTRIDWVGRYRIRLTFKLSCVWH